MYVYICINIFKYPRLRQQPATALDARSSSQVGSQNPSSWAPKSTKLGSKIKKNQSWEVSEELLRPSWPQEAHKKHQDTNKGPPSPPKGTAFAPPRTAFAPPFEAQNLS